MQASNSHIPWSLIKANIADDNVAAVNLYAEWRRSLDLDNISGGELQLAGHFQFKYKNTSGFHPDPRIHGNVKRGLYQWTTLTETAASLRERFSAVNIAFRPIRLSKWLLDQDEYSGLLPYFIDILVDVKEFSRVHHMLLAMGWTVGNSTGYSCTYVHMKKMSVRCFHKLGPIWDENLENEVFALYQSPDSTVGMLIDGLSQISLFGLRDDWVSLYQLVVILTKEELSLEKLSKKAFAHKFLVSGALNSLVDAMNEHLGCELDFAKPQDKFEIELYRSFLNYRQKKNSLSKLRFHFSRWRALNRVNAQRYLPWQYIDTVRSHNLVVGQFTDLIA